MKVVPVLLCIALAHGVTASIFKHSGVDTKVPEYIDEHSTSRYWNPPTATDYQRHYQQLRDHERLEDHRDQTRNQQYVPRVEEPIKQLTEQQASSYLPDPSRLPNYEKTREWHKGREYGGQYGDQYRYAEPDWTYQQVKPQPSSASQSQEQDREQYSTKKQPQHSYNTRPGSSSTESSQEAHEGRLYNEDVKTFSLVDNISKLTSGNLFGKHEKSKHEPTFGDIFIQKGDRLSVGANLHFPNRADIENIFGSAQKTMKHLSDEVRDKFYNAIQISKHQQNDEVVLNVTQLAQKYDIRVEQHTVTTDDGYVLTIFRIPPVRQRRDLQPNPVAFLMHGIDGSADDWLLMGPSKSLAYLLSYAGYDVWLGNARGNKYSNHHVSKHPAVSDFWQYSIDEIALHDLPAMIDYVLKTTNQEKLYYIGHSQGATAFFALTATKPEYNYKIKMMYALSPMVYMTNVRSPLFRMISPTNKIFTKLQDQIGYSVFRPATDLIQYTGGALLEKLIGIKDLSSNAYLVMAGANLDNVDPQVLAMVMRHLPSGTSTKVIKHYGQGVASQDFRKYDYGTKINVQVYGSEQPPKYIMEKVQAPVTLYYSEEDWLAHPKDVERLENELPNVKESYKVTDSHFGSMDFQFSTKAPEMVYTRLIESMQNNQYGV